MISIIGGNYIGGYLAYLLAKKEQDVTVYEEHSQVGKPYRDTGIVTDILSDLVPLKDEFILNVVNKVKIIAGDSSLILPIRNEYVLDQVKFSEYLMELALAEGASLKLNSRFKNFKKSGPKLKLEFSNFNCNTDYLVGADGANSTVARVAGLHKNVDCLMGMEARVKMDVDEDTYEVYPKFVDDFFGWVVPEGNGIARIGLATRDNVNEKFKKFLKMRDAKKILSKNGGVILSYDSKAEVSKDNVYLVGDATGFVKSSTGGGILTGMMAAQELTNSIVEGKNYVRLVKRRIGKELWFHHKIRNTLDKFSEEDYVRLMGYLNQKKIKNIISKINRDYPSKFLFSLLLREPRLIRFAKKSIMETFI